MNEKHFSITDIYIKMKKFSTHMHIMIHCQTITIHFLHSYTL